MVQLRRFPSSQFATYMNQNRMYSTCKDTTLATHMKACTSRKHLSTFAACPQMCARMLESWCYAALRDSLLKEDIKEDTA